jgi:flagellin-like protein
MELRDFGENRAVSPVIGVILMVAITVILSAVIGAFVLEIGDQQETAPNTSFSSDEVVRYIDVRDGVNYTQVKITHAGGDVLDISQTDIVHEGRAGAWGISDEDLNGDNIMDDGIPQPDVRRSLGTNEQVAFKSGQMWRVAASVQRSNSEFVKNKDYRLRSFSNYDQKNQDSPFCRSGISFRVPYFWLDGDFKTDDNGNEITPNRDKLGLGCDRDDQLAPMLMQDDPINVVWRSESGSKTQALFEYNVQNSNPDYSS